ncbi:MAG: hypothetical protein KAH31_04215 [Candidatus Sabulitectum sp.]|nr:hypothetical protein [Candidatus Sabulitectum sp.]
MSLVTMLLFASLHPEIDMDRAIVWEDATRIVYEFGDSSVPPPYHRSFVISVTGENATVVVDSYGEILADESYPITQKQFNLVLKALATSDMSTIQEGESPDCTGGTTETVSVYINAERVLHGWVYHCGGENFGTLLGGVNIVAEAVCSLIPDLAQLRE